MKIIYLSALLCFLMACDAAPSNSTDTTAKADSSKPALEQPAAPQSSSINPQTLDLSDKKVLRRNEYGAGDCWGSITEYALAEGRVAVDSTTCGEYGFTYTRYVFNTKEELIALSVKESETLFGEEEAAFSRIERWIDFAAAPAKAQIKADTVKDYALREGAPKARFQSAELPSSKKSYEQYYKEAWEE